jgi:hypothetical protein
VIQKHILERVTKDYMAEGCSIELRDILKVLSESHDKLEDVSVVYEDYFDGHQHHIQKRLPAGSYVHILLRVPD